LLDEGRIAPALFLGLHLRRRVAVGPAISRRKMRADSLQYSSASTACSALASCEWAGGCESRRERDHPAPMILFMAFPFDGIRHAAVTAHPRKPRAAARGKADERADQPTDVLLCRQIRRSEQERKAKQAD
jgi:hypothetical protein